MKKKYKDRKIINVLIFVIVFFAIIYIIAKFICPKLLDVREYRIESELIPANFSGVKIVHFSDILYKSESDLKQIEKMVEKINVLKPDIVVFTGDLVSKNIKISESAEKEIVKLLGSIDSNIGKYAIFGNEDYSYKNYEDVIKESEFKLLNNSYEIIYNESLEPIFLGGTSSLLKTDIDFEAIFEYFNNNENIYKILLIHEGDVIKELNKTDYKVDLVLGGHSLNGSVVIPFYGGIYIPKGSNKYYAKNYILDNSLIYISSGIGTNSFGLRLFNNPSFNLYRLKSTQK